MILSDFERTWIQRRVVRTKFDIYVLLVSFDPTSWLVADASFQDTTKTNSVI